MDFKVLIADSAIADLKDIVEFVAQHNPYAALRLGEKLVDRASSLRAMPQRFPFHDRCRGIRKMVVRPFRMFYTCDEASRIVNILHFWHGAPRPPDF